MYVIEVIPMLKATNVESLTYYSSQEFSVGTVVEVPVRKKQVRALVTGAEPVSRAKTAVRQATFTLRKLDANTPHHQLSPVLIETAKQLQKIVPATLGSILYALLPKEVREGTAELMTSLPCLGTFESPAVSVLQGLSDERYRVYRSKIREAFAHSGSVMFVVPSASELEYAVEMLSQGIKERVVVLSGSQTPRKNESNYTAFKDLTQAKLIIATPSHAFLDRHDITHIIIDHARSPHYKSRSRPYLDVREALERMARITNRHVILGDILPRTEEEYMRHGDFYLTESEHPKRLVFQSALQFIEQDTSKEIGREFRIISPELENTLREALKNRTNVFCYAARRGLSPLVACVDCGHIVRCPESGAPYSLVRTTKNGEEERWFVCPVSGVRERARDTCGNCGGWRLTERGIGIQQIEDALCELFPDTPIIIFDHTTVRTHRQAKREIGRFFDTKGAILLGTAMVLPYITEPVAYSAITSLDAARSVPTWRADEELLALLLRLRECSTEEVLVQTRTEVDDLLRFAQKGTVDQFYTAETELREAVAYPPFATIIHFTLTGNESTLTELTEAVEHAVAGHKVSFYSPLMTPQDMNVRYGIIRIPSSEWPQEELMHKLRALPPQIRIEVNPHRLI